MYWKLQMMLFVWLEYFFVNIYFKYFVKIFKQLYLPMLDVLRLKIYVYI